MLVGTRTESPSIFGYKDFAGSGVPYPPVESVSRRSLPASGTCNVEIRGLPDPLESAPAYKATY